MALPKSISRVQTGDRNLNQLQQNILPVIEQICANPLVGGAILTNVSLSNGQTTINHGLGRTLQGWTPVRVRAAATLWDSQDVNPAPQSTLILNSNAAVTVDLLVF